MKPYTILMKKTKAGSAVKDTAKDFSVVCLDVEFPEAEMKELESRDYKDENGDYTFIPDKLSEKSYDFKIEAGYRGSIDTWESEMDSFVDYLTGHDGTGVELLLYLPFHKTGRKCRISKIPRPLPYADPEEMVLTFSLEFHVDSPRSRVSMNTSGTNVTLTERTR